MLGKFMIVYWFLVCMVPFIATVTDTFFGGSRWY